MARRRVPSRSGGGTQALMALYGDITARERAQQQAMLQHQLNVQLQRLQSELRTDEAAKADEYNTQQQLLGFLGKDPGLARRMRAGGREDVAGVPLAQFVPSASESMLPFTEEIGKISDPGMLPPQSQVHERVRAAGLLPTDESGTPTEDTRNLTNMIEERRMSILGGQQAADERAAQQKYTETLQGVRATEAGAAEAFPAVLGREQRSGEQANALAVSRERQLTPVMIERTRAQEQAKLEVEQSAADTAGLIAVASSTPLAQSLIETIVGPQGFDPTSGQPYPQDRYALASADPSVGIRASQDFKNAFGPAKGIAMGYLNPNVQARIARLTSQQTTQALTDLRKQVATGASPMGQASDRDVQIVQNGVTQLGSYRMDSAAAEAELKRIYDAAIRLQQRATAAQEKLAGVGRLPSAIGLQPTPQMPKALPSPAGQSLRTSSGRSFIVKQ